MTASSQSSPQRSSSPGESWVPWQRKWSLGTMCYIKTLGHGPLGKQASCLVEPISLSCRHSLPDLDHGPLRHPDGHDREERAFAQLQTALILCMLYETDLVDRIRYIYLGGKVAIKCFLGDSGWVTLTDESIIKQESCVCIYPPLRAKGVTHDSVVHNESLRIAYGRMMRSIIPRLRL